MDTFTTESVTTVPEIYYPFNIVQGDDQYDRDGDEIHATSLQVKWFLQNDLNSDDLYNHIRIIVFKIKMNPEGAISASAAKSLILETTKASTAMQPLLAPYNPGTFGIYKILYDKKIRLFSARRDTGTGLMNGNPSFPMGVYKSGSVKIKLNTKIKYRPGTPGDSFDDYIKNGIFVMAFSDSGAPNHPIIDIYTRAHFKDA